MIILEYIPQIIWRSQSLNSMHVFCLFVFKVVSVARNWRKDLEATHMRSFFNPSSVGPSVPLENPFFHLKSICYQIPFCIFWQISKTKSFSLEHGGGLSSFVEMAKVIRCELPGFLPFTLVFLLQSLPGSCSIKYLPNSTLFSHTWGKSSFSTLFTFPALILSPSLRGRPCPRLPWRSPLHHSMLLPLFTNHPLKLIRNLLITSCQWFLLSSSLYDITWLSPWWQHWQILPPLPGPRFSLKFFLPLDSRTHILALWPFLLTLCWPHFSFRLTCREFSVPIPIPSIFCFLFPWARLLLHFLALDAPACISLPSYVPHLPME